MFFLHIVVCLFILMMTAFHNVASAVVQPLLFPSARRSQQTYTYNSKAQGTVTVPDPYSWTETADSDETKAFVEAQNAYAQQYIDNCNDLDQIKQLYNKVYSYTRFESPRAVGPYAKTVYYYAQNDGTQAQSTWYVATQSQLLAAEQSQYATLPGSKFFDVNLMRVNDTVQAGSVYFYFSPSGHTAAYLVPKSGSDEYTAYFRQTSKPFVQSPTDPQEAMKGGPDRLPDELTGLRYGGLEWSRDDLGVFYQAYSVSGTGGDDDAVQAAELKYHRLGTDQVNDIIIVPQVSDPSNQILSVKASEDGKFLLVTNFAGSSNNGRLYIAVIDQSISASMRWLSVAPDYSYSLTYLANDDDVFYFTSTKDAPNGKVVRTHIDTGNARKVSSLADLNDECTFEDVIAENADAILDQAVVVDGDKLLISYNKDVKNELYQYELKTGVKVERFLSSFEGQVNEFQARRYDSSAFVPVTSLTTPNTVYRLSYDLRCKTLGSRALPTVHQHRTTVVDGLDLSALETRQVFVTSNDGARVPSYLTYRKGTKTDGTAPGLHLFYGGFGISFMPKFDASVIMWVLINSAVLIWTSARGGNEYASWHADGIRLHKKNTFNDVLVTLNYVVDQGIVAKGKVALISESNGGMIALAVSNMAPEGLIGAVVADVPLSDMLRYMHFGVGNFFEDEYGDPESDPETFDYIYSYSPLHNVDGNKTYPFTLITTAESDDRVGPVHALKMIAQLQYARAQNANPLLLRVLSNAGHVSTELARRPDDDVKFCLMDQFLNLKPFSSGSSKSTREK